MRERRPRPTEDSRRSDSKSESERNSFRAVIVIGVLLLLASDLASAQGTAPIRVSSASEPAPLSDACRFELVVDQPSPGVPPALKWCDPSVFLSSGGILVSYYRIFRSRSLTGPFVAVTDIGPPATNYSPTSLDPGATYFFVEARRCDSLFGPPPAPTCTRTSDVVSNVVSVVSSGSACVPSSTSLCVADRFKVSAHWHTGSQNGDGAPVALTTESGYFWFFSPSNMEVSVKVLDACSQQNPAFWVFASGMTNVGVDLTFTDTRTGAVRTHTNPLGARFTTLLDTNAFPCD